MNFNQWAAQTIENDLRNGIVTNLILNKYLMGKTPPIITNEYAYYSASIYKGNYKAELIDKTTFFEHDKLFDIRDKCFKEIDVHFTHIRIMQHSLYFFWEIVLPNNGGAGGCGVAFRGRCR